MKMKTILRFNAIVAASASVTAYVVSRYDKGAIVVMSTLAVVVLGYGLAMILYPEKKR